MEKKETIDSLKEFSLVVPAKGLLDAMIDSADDVSPKTGLTGCICCRSAKSLHINSYKTLV